MSDGIDFVSTPVVDPCQTPSLKHAARTAAASDLSSLKIEKKFEKFGAPTPIRSTWFAGSNCGGFFDLPSFLV